MSPPYNYLYLHYSLNMRKVSRKQLKFVKINIVYHFALNTILERIKQITPDSKTSEKEKIKQLAKTKTMKKLKPFSLFIKLKKNHC